MNAALLATLLVVFASLVEVRALCESPQVEVGVLFHCQLERSSFFQDSPPAANVGVEVSATQQGFAGIPDWLSLLQVNESAPVILYGTPAEEDVGTIPVKLTARRMDTFASETRLLQISIGHPKGRVLLMSELVIINYKMEDFLRVEVFNRFNAALSDAFQTDQSLLLQVLHPAARGLSNQRTIIVVTPGINVSAVSTATVEEASSVQGDCDSNEDVSLPPSNYEAFNLAGFDIDWCKYSLYAVENSSSSSGQDDIINESTDPLRPDSEGSSISLVVVVVVFSVVIVMMVTGLAWVFLGGRKRAFYIPRERKERRSTMVNEIYSSTKETAAAQRHLRNMSQAPLSARMTTNRSSLEERGVAAPPRSVSSIEDELLEYQDVTDFGPDNARLPQSPPPAYQYPEDLLTVPLQQPRRYRLITL